MDTIEQYIYHTFSQHIHAWTEEVKRDIYALSFYVECEEDDARRITVTLGYNTQDHWKSHAHRASSVQEAQWNYAFWLQNQEMVIGSSYEPIDHTGITLRHLWLNTQGLWYSDDDEERDFDRVLEISDEIEQQFVRMCVHVAQQLHHTGVILAAFGRSIPIIVHELAYYDTIAAQTRDANPPGLAQEFENWIMRMYDTE